jgi:hypothetical protein
MHGEINFDHIVNELARGLESVCGYRPVSVSEMISIKELAKRIGAGLTSIEETNEALGEAMLKTLLALPGAETCGAQKKCVHLAHLRVGEKELRVAVIGLESFIRQAQARVMPGPERIAFFFALLADWVVISGQHALVRFRSTLETKEEVWYWSAEMAIRLRLGWLGWMGRDYGSWYILGWPQGSGL